MKILLYGINFAPEQTGVGRYSGEMASWLAGKEHDVRVVTAPPYYPSWRIEPGFRKVFQRWEKWAGVNVWRCPIWVPKRPSGATRVLHLASFAVGSLPAMFRQIFWRPDVVFVVAPAFICAPAGWLVARASGAKAWLHIQDFEVDAAFRLGMLQQGLAQRLATQCERWIMKRFDRVSTISRRMMDHLAKKGVSAERSVLFPNWVDIGAIVPMHKPSPYRAELGIADDAIVALYSGSMAAKQGLHLLVAAARQLQVTLPRMVFVLCGDGVIKSSLEKECEGLGNVHFLPLQPVARLSDLLGLADIHLLPQSAQAADLVMPSKLTGMLASGRPVVTTANAGTELALVVADVGRVVPPENLPAFVAALQELCANDALRARLGAAARSYAEEFLARDRVLKNLDLALRACSPAGGPSMPEMPKTAIIPKAPKATKGPKSSSTSMRLPAVVDKEPLS